LVRFDVGAITGSAGACRFNWLPIWFRSAVIGINAGRRPAAGGNVLNFFEDMVFSNALTQRNGWNPSFPETGEGFAIQVGKLPCVFCAVVCTSGAIICTETLTGSIMGRVTFTIVGGGLSLSGLSLS
jgi:hypothetical protein